MLRFVGDTVAILYILATAVISIALNLTLLTLELLTFIITRYMAVVGMLVGAYGQRVNAVLNGARPETAAGPGPKDSIH